MMRQLLRVLPAFLRVSINLMVQYRGEMFLWAIWGVVYPTVAMAMWSAAAAGSSTGTNGVPDGTIGGFDPHDFAGYFLLTMIVGHLCTAWDVYEMGYFVRSGALSPKLLRPILPIWESLSSNLAYKITTTVILAPLWLVVAVVTHPRFEPSVAMLLLGSLATILAAGLNFVWGYVLALTAFWFTRSEAVGQIWFGAQLFFGGRLAPLAILPPLLQRAADLMPFKWMIYFPSSVLRGDMALASVLTGLLWQSAWFVAGLVAFRVFWRIAMRRYSAVGA